MHPPLHASLLRQLPPIRFVLTVLLAAGLLTAAAQVSSPAAAEQTTSEPSPEASQPGLLQPLNPVVGSWRGVGQPKRGSQRGAWLEKTVCRWDFAGGRPAIRFDTADGKQFRCLTLTVDTRQKQLVLIQQTDESSERIYRGPCPEQWPSQLQLLSDADEDGARYRCTIKQLSDIRLVILFERQSSASGGFRRLAGIGYTRSGHRLAKSGSSQRECVVTGGRGTIAVTHQGKTWYVCCEGCRQAFEDAPDEIIAAFLERQQEASDDR